MHTQEIIALGVVAIAVAYLIYRALRKGKPGCDCCGCNKSLAGAQPPHPRSRAT